MRAPKRPIHIVWTWARRQPSKVQAFVAVVSGMAALVLLRFIVHDHDNLFVAPEVVHSIGIFVLIYKLMKEKTCAVPNPMEEDVEDFEVVEREEAAEEQRAAGEDGGGQREDGNEY